METGIASDMPIKLSDGSVTEGEEGVNITRERVVE